MRAMPDTEMPDAEVTRVNTCTTFQQTRMPRVVETVIFGREQ